MVERWTLPLDFAGPEMTKAPSGEFVRFSDYEALRSDLSAALARNDEMAKAVRKTLTWAEQRCPCRDEQPNPCPLCGASVENLEACKSAENTIPRDVLDALRAAAVRASATKEKAE